MADYPIYGLKNPDLGLQRYLDLQKYLAGLWTPAPAAGLGPLRLTAPPSARQYLMPAAARPTPPPVKANRVFTEHESGEFFDAITGRVGLKKRPAPGPAKRQVPPFPESGLRRAELWRGW